MAVTSNSVTHPLVKDPIVCPHRPQLVVYGSQHTSLSYLLHSYHQHREEDENKGDELNESYTLNHDPDSDSDSDRLDVKNEEIISTLRNLNADTFRNALLANVVKAMEVFRCLRPNTQILNRNVMLFLQNLGYNAAICKTKWESCGGLTAGNYQFIDVVRSDSGVRYFIDLNFAGEFEIARQTNQFHSISQKLPTVFVGKSADLKQIVKLMSNEIRRSLKGRGLLLPPWRKNRFMQNKWFGPYRRTVNFTPANASSPFKVPVNQATMTVKCSLIGFNVVDGAPLFPAATCTR